MRIEKGIGHATLLLALLLATILPLQVAGQPPSDRNEPVRAGEERPQVGLVLGGSGAAGFANAGVLDVIEQAGVQIDYVVATGTGSLTGALYALDYDPGFIRGLTETTNWHSFFQDDYPHQDRPLDHRLFDRRFLFSLHHDGTTEPSPHRFIEGQRMSMVLSELTWEHLADDDFETFPRELALVTTDLVSGEPQVFRSGPLNRIIHGAMAFPGVFRPVNFNGAEMVDGSVSTGLPVEQAERLRREESDILIGVNIDTSLRAVEDLDTPYAISNQLATLMERRSGSSDAKKLDLLIEIRLEEHALLDFHRAEKFVSIGERQAYRNWGALRSIHHRQNRPGMIPRTQDAPPPQPVITPYDSTYVTDITFTGMDRYSSDYARHIMNLSSDVWYGAGEIEEGIERLYNTGAFHQLTYSLEPEVTGNRLYIHAREKDRDAFNVAYNYRKTLGGAVLFNTTHYDLGFGSSELAVDFELSREPGLGAHYHFYLSSPFMMGVRSRMDISQHNYFTYEAGEHQSQVRTNAAFLEASAYPFISPDFILGAGFREEIFDQLDVGDGSLTDLSISSIHMPFAFFEVDTHDDPRFPERGVTFSLRSDLAMIPLPGAVSFTRHELDWNGYHPLNEQLSIVSRARLGITTSPPLPYHYRFFMGGYPGFLGYLPRELSGEHVQMFQLGYQYRLADWMYLQMAGNIGITPNEWEWNFLELNYLNGMGVTLLTDTPLGPAGLTISNSERHPLMFEMHAGFSF